jgi:DNA-binding MarR family transcriptional regulator
MESQQSLSYLLQHTSVIMQRQADQVLQERLGVGMSQYRILMTLQDRPNVQQRFLADSLGQTEASISRQVKLLVERGMLAVQINPQNRREHVTVLTAKGAKITQAAEGVLSEYHGPAFEQLSDREKQQLGTILNAMHQHYCQNGKPYACDLPWFSQFGPEVV